MLIRVFLPIIVSIGILHGQFANAADTNAADTNAADTKGGATADSRPSQDQQKEQQKGRTQEKTLKYKLFNSAHMGLKVGAGFYENALNDTAFQSGFAIGPELEVHVLQLVKQRIGLGLGYFFQTYGLSKGTEEVFVSTNYSRLDLFVAYQFQHRAFLVGARTGLGMSFVSTDYNFSYNQRNDQYHEAGVEPGFIAGLGTGLEFGQSLLKLSNRIEFTIQSDWFRQGRKDSFHVWGLITVSTRARR